jgi:hypothetical protein
LNGALDVGSGRIKMNNCFCALYVTVLLKVNNRNTVFLTGFLHHLQRCTYQAFFVYLD